MWVQSTAIRQIEYDGYHGKLKVRFEDGGLYVYVGVPDAVYRAFVEAPSKGRYFHDEIRDCYPFNRVSG